MVTLNKPAAGDTNWATPVNDNWTAVEKQVIAFQGRLQRDSSTQVSLQRYMGDTVDVNGTSVSLGASGISLATTDNLITSTGADAGSAMTASTLYYVYVSNAGASPFPGDLRASTTAPSLYNGVKYLGTSGNAANWRFVGWVRTDGSTQFVDSEAKRLVINYYNRRQLSLAVAETTATWTYAGSAYQQARASAANQVELISNGEDASFAQVVGAGRPNLGASGNLGIGDNSTTVNSAQVNSPDSGSTSASSALLATLCRTLAEGYHALAWLEKTNGVTFTFYGSASISGVACGMSGHCMG